MWTIKHWLRFACLCIKMLIFSPAKNNTQTQEQRRTQQRINTHNPPNSLQPSNRIVLFRETTRKYHLMSLNCCLVCTHTTLSLYIHSAARTTTAVYLPGWAAVTLNHVFKNSDWIILKWWFDNNKSIWSVQVLISLHPEGRAACQHCNRHHCLLCSSWR